MMKTVCLVFVVAFAMEHFCASAQQSFTVSACKDGILQLNCRTGLIGVENVVLADSRCSGSGCCPRQGDCSGSPSEAYRNRVYANCNGRSSCSMDVEILNIGCGIFPRNDYANITYKCLAIQTSPASTLLATQSPIALSRSNASTWQHVTTSISTPINIHPYTSDDKISTEIEKEEGDMTSSQSSAEGSTKLNPEYRQKPEEATAGSGQGKSESQVQTDHAYLDRVTTLVGLIVGGVVITATVISVAVVFALKKRRVAKSEEQYDMPNYPCNANTEDENIRNSNFYDFIPDSGNCSAGESASVDCTAKENDYLTPVMESEDSPYLWIA